MVSTPCQKLANARASRLLTGSNTVLYREVTSQFIAKTIFPHRLYAKKNKGGALVEGFLDHSTDIEFLSRLVVPFWINRIQADF